MINIEKICCVIVTYNCGEEFLKTFNSVFNQVGKVVIVDNGSQKNTLNILEKLEDKAKIICLKENLGIATALNLGVNYALKNKFEWVLTLDHDSILDKCMVRKLSECYENLDDSYKKIVVSLLPQYIEMGNNSSKNNELDEFFEVEAGITSGNMVKCSAFKSIGLFNESLFIDYVDNEFCYRIINNGFKIIQIKDAILYHRLGDTQVRRFLNLKLNVSNHSVIRRYYITRNRFYCWSKYSKIAPLSIKLDKKSFIKEFIKIVLYEEEKFNKLKMILKGYKDFKKCNYGKYINI